MEFRGLQLGCSHSGMGWRKRQSSTTQIDEALLSKALRYGVQGTVRGTGLAACWKWVQLLCCLGARVQYRRAPWGPR